MMDSILQNSAVILTAALGALIAERAGILNIAVEGLMIFGAYIGVMAATFLGSSAPAFLAAIISGIALMALFALFVLRYRANQFVVGLAINLLAAGIAPLLSEVQFQTRGSVRLPGTVPVPDTTALVLVAVAALLLTALFLRYTVSGLRIQVAGQEPSWLAFRGLSVNRPRLLALLISGAAGGLSGALLSLRLGVYLPNISAGRGWIALVVIFLGYRRPGIVAFAALLFGGLEALAVRAQALLDVPPSFLLALPYVLTVLAFVSYSAVRKIQQDRQ